MKLLRATIAFTLGISAERFIATSPSGLELTIVILAASLIVGAAIYARRHVKVPMLLLLLLFGITRAVTGVPDSPIPWSEIPRNESRVSLEGTLLSNPAPSNGRIRLRLRVETNTAPNTSYLIDVFTDRLHDETDTNRRSDDFRYGDTFRTSGRFILTTDRDDIVGLVSTSSVDLIGVRNGGVLRSYIADIRARISDSLVDSLDSESGGLAAALLVGDRTKLLPETITNFRASGLSHVLAISGLHIAMVGGIIMAVSVWVLGRQRQYYLIAPTMGVWGYAVLAGLTPSVTRAAIMFTVYMATRLLGRQRRVLPPLALAAAVMLAIDPEIIASISFQLSFVAVLGIALFSGRFAGRSGDWVQNSTRLPKLTKRPLIGAMYGASVSLAATIATAPLIAFHFGEIPIWGIPSTLLIVPVLPLFLAGSVLAAIAGLVTAQPVAISGLLAHAMGGYMSWVSEMFASTPIGPLDASGWSLPLIVGWYAIVLLLLNRRAAFEMSIKTINLFKKKNSNSSPVVRRENFLEGRAFVSVIAIWAVAAISFLGFVWSEPESTNLTVTFFETNRGDMIFVESPSGARLLVDAGDDSDLAVRNLESVLPALDHRIDLLLSTHPDADHLGGLQRIVERFDVGSIIDSGVNHDSNIYQSWAQMLDDDDRVTIAEAGMVVALDQDVRLRILQTRCVFVECSNFNDEGVVARLEFGEVSFLLTGDMTSGGEIDLLQTGQMVNSSVLKVGHHGSRTSTTRQFLDAVEPALAIVTTGVKNQFGHPHEDVIVRLTNQLGGDLVYITRNNGTITATTNGQRVWVATER